ncbi:latrophilin Cirl isoform X2 [Lepeophtheirus salmonis]|uniref:latrophilin Cirl isoform X2 n=1 Tax=Lepeophtheirus salmonis TaxID=72036 RepID=UPI001AE31BBB|nr:latrophilin Cirl-like isoform X2 [Lepeophtheirus salmonis]
MKKWNFFSWFLYLLVLIDGVFSDPDSVSVPFPDGKAPDGTRYKKDYRCESEQITIGCKVHERIRVIRANYGRFSLAVCNKHGSTELSVNCMSPQTTGILQSKCDNLSNCTMQVNSHVFGEPCAGVRKYLEVHYACITQSGLHSGTTPRLPSWLLEGAAGNLWQDNKDSYFEDLNDDEDDLEYEEDFEDIEDENDLDISQRRKPILVQATTPVRIPITTPKPTTSTTTTPVVSSTSEANSEDPGVRVNELAHVDQLEIVSNQNNHFDDPSSDFNSGCPPVHSRFLYWNRTSPGEVSIQPCPEGTTGLARWICGHDEERETSQPDMSDCKSHTMSELEASVRNEEPESVIASRLSILTGKRFFGGDLETSVSVVKSISNRLQYLIRHKENFYNKASFVSDVFQNIFRSASNLLNNHLVWKDLSETSRRSKVASDMVSVLEDCAFLWADSLEEPEIVYESTNNAVMAISSTSENSQTFPSTPNTPEWFGNQDSISISLTGDEKELNKMVFFSYKDLHYLLPPKKLEANLVSRVISADVRRKNNREEKDIGLSIHFHHNRSGGPPPSCSRWDEDIGDWSLEGCYILERETSYVKCSCNSPGMFALVTAKESLGGFPDEKSIHTSTGSFSDIISLEIATYIVSVICFLILVLIVIQFRKQIRKLFKKSGCGCCCCICMDRENSDKSRDLYTGATLMEAASSGANASTTTASSSSGSSTSTTLPSRMVTALSADSNRVGILHYNNPTVMSLNNHHHIHHQEIPSPHHQYQDVLYGNNTPPNNNPNCVILETAYGGSPISGHFMSHPPVPLNNNLPQMHHHSQPPPPPPQKLNNPLYPNRREDKEYKYPLVSDEREYAYHSESSSSGVSGSSSSSRLQRRSPGDIHTQPPQSSSKMGRREFPPYREAPLYHGQPRGIPSEAGCP